MARIKNRNKYLDLLVALLLKKFSASQRFISVLQISSPVHILNQQNPVSTHRNTHIWGICSSGLWRCFTMGELDPTSWRTKFPHLQGCRCVWYLHPWRWRFTHWQCVTPQEKRVLKPRLCENLKALTRIHLFKVHLPYFPPARLSLPIISMLLSCKIFWDTLVLSLLNPSTTLVFAFPLLPRKEKFWILVTSMHSRTYDAPRQAACKELKNRAVHPGRHWKVNNISVFLNVCTYYTGQKCFHFCRQRLNSQSTWPVQTWRTTSYFNCSVLHSASASKDAGV